MSAKRTEGAVADLLIVRWRGRLHVRTAPPQSPSATAPPRGGSGFEIRVRPRSRASLTRGRAALKSRPARTPEPLSRESGGDVREADRGGGGRLVDRAMAWAFARSDGRLTGSTELVPVRPLRPTRSGGRWPERLADLPVSSTQPAHADLRRGSVGSHDDRCLQRGPTDPSVDAAVGHGVRHPGDS